jgi:acyl-[acyl-carrier-protein]-phospholipid O-acyltransferase / long-chain-fatty-acid--[acyl-carrier-protein] ligase
MPGTETNRMITDDFTQPGTRPPFGEECLILIPNKISKSDLLALASDIIATQSKLILLLDSSHPRNDELGIDSIDPHFYGLTEAITSFDFSSGSDDELRSIIEPFKNNGNTIIYIPAKASVRKGANFHFPSNNLRKILSLGIPSIPLFIERIRETTLSIDKEQGTIHSYGEILRGADLTIPSFQESLLEAGEKAFSSHSIFNDSLPYSIIKGLKNYGSKTTIFDGNDGTELVFTKVFAAAAALSRVIKKETQKKRVGIVLTPGRGGLIANLAVLLSDKIPVNLNFTAGSDAITSSMEQADLDKIITAGAFVEKYPGFPWPDDNKILFIEKILPPLKKKKKITLWFIALKFFSPKRLASMLGIAKEGGDKEAVLLFTSGSSGNPKGVVLTHRNILANVSQFGSRLDLSDEDKVLGCLPLFHSFGSTVTLWYPMLEGVDLVTYPSPLDPPKLANLIQKHKVTLLLATPTFLRGYMRRVDPEQLETIKYVVTGAEKLPQKLAEAFSEKFGKKVMEGYGLTETSPVSNVNIPNVDTESNEQLIPSERLGSVGQFLPGVAIRITDTNDDTPVPIDRSGMIWLKGSNIFKEYLHLQDQTNEVIKDKWFRTGDIGRVDEDGFLFIEGRLSRFSKIGGEMVPHETIEAHVNKALGYDSEAEKKVAIVGVPDEAKGEALVMLCSVEMDNDWIKALRQKLLDSGVAALWIPKKIVKVEGIPSLASGKLDIKGCEELAKAQQ